MTPDALQLGAVTGRGLKLTLLLCDVSSRSVRNQDHQRHIEWIAEAAGSGQRAAWGPRAGC